MIYIFVAIMVFGLVQIIALFYRERKINKVLSDEHLRLNRDNANKQSFSDGLKEYIEVKKKLFKHYFLGKNNEKGIKTFGIILAVVVAVSYVNVAYLEFDFTLMLTLTVLITVYMIYVSRKNRYRREFERDFSEALNIITSTVRVGRPVMQGFEACSDAILTDFGQEFRRILQRLDIGDNPESVLLE